jgi:hypothetical protein
MPTDHDPQTVLCQHCGAEAPAGRTMCPQCRRRMVPRTGAPATPEPEPVVPAANAPPANDQPPPSTARDALPPGWYPPPAAPPSAPPPPMATAWTAPASQFRADMATTLRAWTRAPGLVIFTAAIGAASGGLSALVAHGATAWSLLLLAVALFGVGFNGTQRVWTVNAAAGRRFGAAHVWPMSWRYFGRFFRLGLMLIWPAFVLGIIVALATGGNSHRAANCHHHRRGGLRLRARHPADVRGP